VRLLTWAGAGRQIWGGLLNRTRDFVRMGVTWFPDDPALKAQLLRYTVAFSVGTKVHVRGDEDMRTELEKILLRASPCTTSSSLACVPLHHLFLSCVRPPAPPLPLLRASPCTTSFPLLRPTRPRVQQPCVESESQSSALPHA
jgi:hypothetical protein